MSTSSNRFLMAGTATGGYSTPNRATCTCLCGDVQLEVPTEKPGLVNTFICNCSDCHKITASAFASNFTARDSEVKHLRGKDKLTSFAQSKSIASGNTMTNFFCSTCGTLMYRSSSGYPGMSFYRIGTIDDFELQSTKFKPQSELFIEHRMAWLKGTEDEGIPQFHGMGPSS